MLCALSKVCKCRAILMQWPKCDCHGQTAGGSCEQAVQNGEEKTHPLLYFQSLIPELAIILPAETNGHHLLVHKTCAPDNKSERWNKAWPFSVGWKIKKKTNKKKQGRNQKRLSKSKSLTQGVEECVVTEPHPCRQRYKNRHLTSVLASTGQVAGKSCGHRARKPRVDG